MARKGRVAPESSQSEDIKSAKSSNNNSLLAFENSELSSAITGKVIETNDKTNENLRLSNANSNTKSKRTSTKPRKRIARSVSEVVEEKERQEKNVFRRFNSDETTTAGEDTTAKSGGGGASTKAPKGPSGPTRKIEPEEMAKIKKDADKVAALVVLEVVREYEKKMKAKKQ